MPALTVTIRPAREADIDAIVAIYQAAVNEGTANCELSPLSRERAEAWLRGHTGKFRVFVADEGGEVAGFSALSPYDHKPCFTATAYSSTYVRSDLRGRGLGRALREHVIAQARHGGFHSIVNRIFSHNEASIALTRSLGFVQVGHIPALAIKDGQWLDCTFFQLVL
jgi:L-amino acid N-acyltransferase